MLNFQKILCVANIRARRHNDSSALDGHLELPYQRVEDYIEKRLKTRTVEIQTTCRWDEIQSELENLRWNSCDVMSYYYRPADQCLKISLIPGLAGNRYLATDDALVYANQSDEV